MPSQPELILGPAIPAVTAIHVVANMIPACAENHPNRMVVPSKPCLAPARHYKRYGNLTPTSRPGGWTRPVQGQAARFLAVGGATRAAEAIATRVASTASG